MNNFITVEGISEFEINEVLSETILEQLKNIHQSVFSDLKNLEGFKVSTRSWAGIMKRYAVIKSKLYNIPGKDLEIRIRSFKKIIPHVTINGQGVSAGVLDLLIINSFVKEFNKTVNFKLCHKDTCEDSQSLLKKAVELMKSSGEKLKIVLDETIRFEYQKNTFGDNYAQRFSFS